LSSTVMVRILITSGNSNTGFNTLKALKALGETDIVVGARDVSKSEKKLKEAGASQVVELDLAKPETLLRAFQGVERALLVSGMPTGAHESFQLFAKNFADAAKATPTVNFIARVSGLGSNPNGNGVARIQGLSDALIKTAGINWVTFQPSFFMDNMFGNKFDILRGEFHNASGDGKVGFVAPVDVGAVIAHVMANPTKTRVNAELPITGPVAISDADFSSLIAKELGIKSFSIKPLTLEEFEQRLYSFGLADAVVQVYKTLTWVKLNGYANVVTDAVEKITGRPAITPAQWVQENALGFSVATSAS